MGQVKTVDAGEIINRCFLFFDLEIDLARELYQCFEERDYRIGEDVFQSGDPGECLYILGKGEVKISSVDSKGQNQVVASLIEGDVIGEMAIVTGRARSGKCTFISNGKLLMLPLDKYKEMKIASPKLYVAITRNIAKIVSARLADMTEKVTSLIDGLHSVEDSQIDLEAQLAKGKIGLLDFIGLSRKKSKGDN
jgi:CRP-like cAMP-binding protein